MLSEPVGHFHFCHFLPLFAGLNRLKPASGKKHFLPAEMPTLIVSPGAGINQCVVDV